MYVRRILIPFLALGVVSSPLFLFNDDQPQLGGASLTLLGNSACPPLPGYGTLPSTNVTQAGNDTSPSQTTYASATEIGSLPVISSSASIVASPSTTGASDRRCTKIIGTTLEDYRFPTYDLQALLSPAKGRFFMFRFVRNGGGLLIVNISGRPQDSPDVPESYKPLAYEAFIHGDLQNTIPFNVSLTSWVNVHLRFGSHTQPLWYVLEVFQIDNFW